ncbi:hypothetical protein [Marinobacter oulmenensis]|uniref:Uncharacterized protein n=1 Tax=Marinobacter oulmenensis TaxID=643747 RepID=A0A840UAJ2_9GAMM|nr:hypothetical protein [Marinobacter oulmenensis]MBB5321223.1 hypothetical protein [Marinobacter oulmenensis]
MAENETADASAGAVLRPGRSADPVPQDEAGNQPPAEQGTTSPAPDAEPAESSGDPQEGESASSGEDDEEDSERLLAESRQRKLRLMLRQCDRVLLLDFDLLAMSDWPDNFQMAEARRARDVWIFSALAAASVFLSGLTGFVPAWVAGGGLGAFAIILLLGVPFVRRIYTSRPSYMDLLMKRQRMVRDARKHVAHLEGEDGLVWQCTRLAEFNPTLKHPRFSRLVRLSEQRILPAHLSRREHIRLYLIYLLEAEKGYTAAQQAFFEGNQEAIDRGWKTVAAEPQQRE